MLISVCMCTHVWVGRCSAQGSQKRAPDHLALELQVVVSRLT